MGKTHKKDWLAVASKERRYYQYERNPNVKKRNQERFDGRYLDDD